MIGGQFLYVDLGILRNSIIYSCIILDLRNHKHCLLIQKINKLSGYEKFVAGSLSKISTCYLLFNDLLQ